jgi:hypothetical protein
MAYDKYDDEFDSTEEALAAIRSMLGELDEKVKTMADSNEDASAGLRMDVGQSRREMVHLRSSLQRLQARFDNQLTVMVLSNIASGVGVAAIVLAATQGSF